MAFEISEKREKELRGYGFGYDVSDTEASMAFPGPVMSLDTHMLVTGEIYYANLGDLCGFFYSPSILGRLCYYRPEFNIDYYLRRINRESDNRILAVEVSGYPMLYVACPEEKREIKYAVSDMLKLVGELDYLLPKRLRALLRAGGR